MRTLKMSLCLFLLLVLSSSMAMAQTIPVTPCPTGKACTVFLWMNGVLGGTDSDSWKKQVMGSPDPPSSPGYKGNYLASHTNPVLPSNLVVEFQSVFNHGGTNWTSLGPDLTQSDFQRTLLAGHQVDINDPDFQDLLKMIESYSYASYKVVLVGHSQGSLYMDLAYQGIQDKMVGVFVTSIRSLPDNSKLQIVNIATPAENVADGNGMYTTQCGDGILMLSYTLPANINNGYQNCVSGSESHLIYWHLLDTYLLAGSQTQRQIYADLDMALGLPDPGCTDDVNCYLKDNFMGEYITRWRQTGDLSLAQGSTIDTASHLGTLQLTSYNNYSPDFTGPGIASAPARLSLRSRRVFTGPFTVSFQYNVAVRFGDGFTHISLNNALDDFPELGLSAVKTGWRNLVFTKTDTQISLSVDGVLLGSNPSSLKDGYYLEFDLQGNNTLQIQNLSVVRGITAPLPFAMTLTPTSNTLTMVQENSGSVDLTLTSKNGMTGNPNLQLYCMQVCPVGFTYNFPQGSATNLPADGSIPIHLTFSTNTSATPGTYNFQYWSTLSGITVKAAIAVIVTAKPVGMPSMTLAPIASVVSVVRGNPVTVNLTLASQNGMTGNPTINLYCSVSCPTGFTYSYTSGSTRTLLANGTLPISATFTPSSSSALGVSNFEYWAVLNGLTVKATIAVTVTAPTSTTGTVVVTTTSSVVTACSLNGTSITAPVTLTNQAVGTKSLSCTAPTGYTLNSVSPASQTLAAGGTASFVVTLTQTAPTTGTVVINSNMGATCSLNGAAVSVPTNLTGKAAGSYTLSCAPPSGYTVSVSPTSQNLVAGGTITFTVNITAMSPFTVSCSFAQNPATVGQYDMLTIFQNGGVAPVNYAVNGASIGLSNMFNVFLSTAGVLTDSVSATDAIGRVASNSCSVTVVAPTSPPALSYLTVNTQPKVNTTINVSLFGSNFVNGTQAFICNSSGSGCITTTTVYVNSGQLTLPSIYWGIPTTLYIKVTNPSGLSSGFLTMVVIN